MGGLITAALIGAGISAGAGMISQGRQARTNFIMQKDQQLFNAKESAKQREWASNETQLGRDFEERMSSTAYQRARQDIEDAGLNPALLMNSSAAASTPSQGITSGSSASSSANSVGQAFNGTSDIVNNIVSTAARETLQKNEFEFKKQLRQEINSSAKELHQEVSKMNFTEEQLKMADDLPF